MPPTRSAAARRVCRAEVAVRCELIEREPGWAGVERSVAMMARMTDSGCKVLKHPSRWAVPAPTVGYSPRTRATSKLITCMEFYFPVTAGRPWARLVG